MDFERIERLMRMLEASSLNELDLTEGGMRIKLAKLKGGLSGDVTPLAQPAAEPGALRNAGVKTIRAGMAGTFYRAPAPGHSPFVEIGSEVREGDQLGIIEAMKMLNPLEADSGGTIRAILMADGGSVEPGIALFEIETG